MWKPERGLITSLALGCDALLGDPPNRFHPVAWMGSGIKTLERYAPLQNRGVSFLYGGLIMLGGALVTLSVGSLLEHLCRRLPAPFNYLAEAFWLNTCIAGRGLAQAGGEIEGALSQGNLPDARRLLSWHLVSRNTDVLNTSQVCAASIESIAENTSDGIIAPLFFYQVGGLPSAFLYRFTNTADAMLGYHDSMHEWLGKIPARLDDLFNLIPARLTAALTVLAAAQQGFNWRRSLFIWRRDASRTASPNAGHAMSAAAGALEVQLEKVGFYRLGEGLPPPRSVDIGKSVRLMRAVTLLAAIGCLVLSLLVCKRRRPV